MENVIEKKVVVKTRDGKTSLGKVSIQQWSQPERLKRALKFGGFSWLLAVGSVFLPIAHFILVPLFLLAGPVVAILTFKQESVVLGGETICPSCQKPLPIVRSPNKWPLGDLCSSCQNHVVIEAV